MLADAEGLELDPESREALAADLEDDTNLFRGVFEPNCSAVAAFCRIATQWRTGLVVAGGDARTIWIGLDYGAALAALTASGVSMTPELFQNIQIMEGAALATLNGRRS